MRPVGDRSQIFALVLGGAWVVFAALPLALSMLIGRPARGLPLLGVAVWFVLLRGARWLSPASRCDELLRRGDYAEARALCDTELAIGGPTAWHGNRRIAWLNRRTSALLGVGQLSAALVAALEALEARPDPETLANCAQCLLWLNRYNEAAGAARLALSLTRERSISSHAVLANVLLAEGRPAEAQAMAQAGVADIEALLPLVQPAHHVALLAVLCRIERALDNAALADTHLATLRRVARRNPLLRAYALLEEADELATGEEDERAQAFELLERAIQLAPHYACWYVTQPFTVHELRDEPRFTLLVEWARTIWSRNTGSGGQLPDQGAPPTAFVAMELAMAQQRGYVRPAPHASRRALAVQVLTLAGTLALLVCWTWRFFLQGSG